MQGVPRALARSNGSGGRSFRFRGCALAGAGSIALSVVAGLALGASPTEAAFPGQNGKIACEGARAAAGVSTSEVFTVNPDGTGEAVLTHNLVRDGDPSVSPDGNSLAFESLRDGFSEAYRMRADGTEQTRLTFSGPNEDRGTSWSPNGSKIVFHSTRDLPLDPSHSAFEIYTMNSDGTDQTRLTNNGVQDSLPAWSPDGGRIAFLSTRDGDIELYTMKPNGTDVRRLTNSPGEDAHASWSPDGRQITFHSRRDGNLDVYRMSSDGSGPTTRLTNTATAFEYFPAWSPDGTRIAFNGNLDDAANTDVYTIDADDGGDLRRVTTAPGFDGRCDWGPVPQPAALTPPGGGGNAGGSGGGLLPGACANERRGTDASEVIQGTSFGDRIVALGGDDRSDGLRGADCLLGGAGGDRLTGGPDHDRLSGDSGNDRLSGGDGDDSLLGGKGNDRLSAGEGKNSLSGGSGNDRINAVNRRRDKVNCGSGRDVATTDRADRVRGCDRRRVVRFGASPRR